LTLNYGDSVEKTKSLRPHGIIAFFILVLVFRREKVSEGRKQGGGIIEVKKKGFCLFSKFFPYILSEIFRLFN